MLSDVLAKSRPTKRFSGVKGVASELFDGAVRTAHHPLTPEFAFKDMKNFLIGLRLVTKTWNIDKIQTLYIHGHGVKYADGVALEMGDDHLHPSTINGFVPAFKTVGNYMDSNGEVKFLHCFAGAGEHIMPKLSKAAGCKVSGEIKLNNLSPVLTPIQNTLGRIVTGDKGDHVRAGVKTYDPDGTVTLEK